ncbi:hypothetical protein [Mycoplasmopsis bovigenitalium]|uniref:hypothetical protein n=1 Tax=Mycoplasmopsis bovigenitalium TaxID=2112 RepID=UPI000BBA5974|nr:hypothetical protein [Mycoplasmopsis bovigenitalium]
MKKHKLLLSVGVLSSTTLPISLTSCHKQEVNEIKKNTQTVEQEKDINTVAANVKVKFIGEASKTHASDVKENQIEFTNIEDGYQKTDVSLRPDDKNGILSVEFVIQKGEEKSNLITKEFTGFLIKTDEAITTPEGGEQDNPSKQTQPENGAQPGNNSENHEILPKDQADNGNTNTSEKDKYLMPELYEPSVKGALFVVNEDHKSEIPALLDKVISSEKSVLKISDGKVILGKAADKSKTYITVSNSVSGWEKVNTNKDSKKGKEANISLKGGNSRGIKVVKENDKYTLKWVLFDKNNKKGTEEFSQTLDLTSKSTSASSENSTSTPENKELKPNTQPSESLKDEKQNASTSPEKQKESEKPESNVATPPITGNTETNSDSSQPPKDSNKEKEQSNKSETDPKEDKEKEKKEKTPKKKTTKKKEKNLKENQKLENLKQLKNQQTMVKLILLNNKAFLGL